MTPKDIYIMGRAEYLTDHEGYSLAEACKIAEKEWDKSKEGEGMMNANEIADTWKEIVRIYNERSETTTPEETMNEIIHKFGIKKTEIVFATVAAIKKHDGRIYGANRDYMNSIPVDPQIVEWRSGNPVVYAGLDDIHTAHIDQLITELRKLDK